MAADRAIAASGKAARRWERSEEEDIKTPFREGWEQPLAPGISAPEKQLVDKRKWAPLPDSYCFIPAVCTPTPLQSMLRPDWHCALSVSSAIICPLQERKAWAAILQNNALPDGRSGCCVQQCPCRRGATRRCGESPHSANSTSIKFRLSVEKETPQRTSVLAVSSILYQEIHMPVIAWLLGVPITVVILLMLFGVF